MLSPEEQQIEICLLKSNLEEIENDLVAQRSALPALDAENEQKYNETISILRVVRSLNNEIEKLKLENVRLTAKRMQLKHQCDDITESLETARCKRNELTNSLEQEESEIEAKIRQYEDSLLEKADRFRNTRSYYNVEEVNKEKNKVDNIIVELETELVKKQGFVEELKTKVDRIQPEIPENLLGIIGKLELDEKCKVVVDKHRELAEKRKLLFL